MKNIAALTPAVAFAVALSAAPVVAQMKDAKPQAPAPAMSADKGSPMKEDAKPAARKRASTLAGVDARHCLQQTTNMAIHRCAEKYRPR